MNKLIIEFELMSGIILEDDHTNLNIVDDRE